MGRRKPLRWRIVTTLLVAALLPLGLAGFGSWAVFSRLLEEKALEQMRATVRSHARAIEAYLSERVSLLRLLAESYPLHDISSQERLQHLFSNLNRSTGGGFVDLGVIDTSGRHLNYVGPYELLGRNYRESDWFDEVMAKGVHVSDVFLGFRQEPHCIIALKTEAGREPWILRATMNSAQFNTIVGTEALGENSDAYVVNGDGQYQTTPKAGMLLGSAPAPMIGFHEGVQDRRIMVDDVVKIEATTWINDRRWMLVVRQDLATVEAPVRQAIARVAPVVLIAVAFLAATAFVATWHLTSRIDKADAEREELSQAFMRSAKLASIGELATGLAHEINNPLAILSAEQTNISDLLSEARASGQWCEQALDSVERCQTQVRRCASITQKMLQFGRQRDTTPELTDIAPRLKEMTDLLQRHANVRNVEVALEVEGNLPQVVIDPVELEQVVVNLINNSIDALPEGGHVKVKAYAEGDQLFLEVRDNGVGVRSENLDRIFEPFFSTKPAGQGTGLGLSVCYGIVHSWGGSIKVNSEPGKGTTMRIRLPLSRQNRLKS